MMELSFVFWSTSSPCRTSRAEAVGTEADAVVNTGTDSNVIITLLNETSEEPDKTGNTAYAGSIEGAAQLVKDGEQRLTVDGRSSLVNDHGVQLAEGDDYLAAFRPGNLPRHAVVFAQGDIVGIRIIIQFNDADNASLTLGNLTLTLTADAVAAFRCW